MASDRARDTLPVFTPTPAPAGSQDSTAQAFSPRHADAPPLTPQELAEASARLMWEEDRAAQAAGMRLLAVGPGTASMSMEIAPHMTNGHGMCHGGFIFMLADTAFAYACNSHNQRAVAAGAEIHFVAPAQLGERLVAHAIECHLGGRAGVYDVTVSAGDGRRIALLRGRSATIKGQFVATADTPNAGKSRP